MNTIKSTCMALALVALTSSSVKAESSMEQAQGQVETYLTILETPNGKAVLARMMVHEYRKATQAAIEAVDQMSERRLQSLVKEYEGSEVGEELAKNPESAREMIKTMITTEERIVSETLAQAFEQMSDEEIRTSIVQVNQILSQHAAQNFSVGDVLKKVVSVIAKVVGGTAFIIGAAIRFPVVFTYHFLKNFVGTGLSKTGETYKSDRQRFRGGIFDRYVKWIGKQLEKEANSWDGFTDRWRREIPER